MISAARFEKANTVFPRKRLTSRIGLSTRLSHLTNPAMPASPARISQAPALAGSKEKPYIMATNAVL